MKDKNGDVTLTDRLELEQFNERGRVLGGKTLCYLLNASRITKIPHDERTFHVFYYLLHANPGSFSDQEKSHLRLQESFAYINQSRLIRQESVGVNTALHGAPGSAPRAHMGVAGMGMDDSLGFDNLKAAMAACGFKPRQTQHVWRLLAAILHLGNLQFADPASPSKQSALQEAAVIKNNDVLEFIADILGVPSGEFTF